MYSKAIFCMTQISQLVMLHNLFPTASSPFHLVVHQLTIWMLHITQQNIWDAFSKQIPFDNMRCWKYERGKRGGKPILLRRVEKMAWSSEFWRNLRIWWSSFRHLDPRLETSLWHQIKEKWKVCQTTQYQLFFSSWELIKRDEMPISILSIVYPTSVWHRL